MKLNPQSWALLAACTLGAATVGLVGRDLACNAAVSKSLLCERADGSLWRDPSRGCSGGEDRRCANGVNCEDSTILYEGWRHSCAWLLPAEEAEPTGPEPHYIGPSPGGGRPGRAG